MSWLLDADVLSQPAKTQGDSRVIAWLRAERDNCYTSAVVIASLFIILSDVLLVRVILVFFS